MVTISPLKYIKTKYDVWRGKHCMKRFCECLKKHGKRIINFKKKKTKLLIHEQQESYESAKSCCICGERFTDKYSNDKYTGEYRGAAHSICNLKHSIPR